MIQFIACSFRAGLHVVPNEIPHMLRRDARYAIDRTRIYLPDALPLYGAAPSSLETFLLRRHPAQGNVILGARVDAR